MYLTCCTTGPVVQKRTTTTLTGRPILQFGVMQSRPRDYYWAKEGDIVPWSEFMACNQVSGLRLVTRLVHQFVPNNHRIFPVHHTGNVFAGAAWLLKSTDFVGCQVSPWHSTPLRTAATLLCRRLLVCPLTPFACMRRPNRCPKETFRKPSSWP